jgi:hypothetical protein
MVIRCIERRGAAEKNSHVAFVLEVSSKPRPLQIKVSGNRPSHGSTWELLRFHSKLEKSSDEVEDVKDDRPIGPASERFDLLASSLTL